MSIVFDRERQTLTLHTVGSSYQMQIGPLGVLLHLYYGPRCEGCFDYLYLPRDRGFSPNPHEKTEGRGFSLDNLPQEYSGSNCGDFRLPSLRLHTDRGVTCAELRYLRHEIRPGKYALEGLPCAWDRGGEAETLSVTLRDEASGLEVELLYGVFEALDVITRAVRITNRGGQTVTLEAAASACLDLPFGRWDCLHFPGRHTGERQTQRCALPDGITAFSSTRGMSGHQHNPFVLLCDRDATEDAGACYGLMLAYSGNHETLLERDQTGSLRAVTGIGTQNFSWQLRPGERFETPEALLCFSAQGLTPLSQRYHRFLRQNVCRGFWAGRRRPVLLNSWEAAYFDFDEASILRLAREAKALGAELLVLDDGWFGHRQDDRSSLGDWFANPAKLPRGLGPLVEGVRKEGLLFGIWLEPEGVSEDSELYRAHPDWALRVPGRLPALSRDQLVLDLSRKEVTDYLYETISALLREHAISYVKWDMNRGLADLYSAALPPERQGELAHRYMLGLYALLDRLTREFPEVLFEGCAGGGGRFDAGMLAYCPQIWASDNSEAVSRLAIQEGTSYGYPASALGAHVSACPNHQTGRSVPLGTRAVVAMAGTFGYELDPARLTEAEKAEIREQIARFRDYDELVRTGDHYRLRSTGESACALWAFVAADKSAALLSFVLPAPEANAPAVHVRLKGLASDGVYRLARADFFGCLLEPQPLPRTRFTGAELMCGGLTLPALYGDAPSAQLLFIRDDA